MRVLKGNYTIWCEPCEKALTAKDLAKEDKRIIYLGDVKDTSGQTIHDAFVFSLHPYEVLTIEKAEVKNGHVCLDYKRHTVNNVSRYIPKEYYELDHEVYIGTVYNASAEGNHRVYHDVYEVSLGSCILFQKDAKGRKRVLFDSCDMALAKSNLNYIDRIKWRIRIVRKRNGKEVYEDYAFRYGESAYSKWISLSPRTKAYQNFAPNVEAIDDWMVRNWMEQLSPELQQRFADSYNVEGFLDTRE